MRALVPGLPEGVSPSGLIWGIKASFLQYIARMPDGRASAGAGAVPVDDEKMFFTYNSSHSPDRGDATVVTRSWLFDGDVRYVGHSGMLFVRLARPNIVLHGAGALLSIEDPHDGPDAPRIPLVEVHFGAPTIAGELEIRHSDRVRLTAEGTFIFNDVYPDCEEFDPMTVIVPRERAG